MHRWTSFLIGIVLLVASRVPAGTNAPFAVRGYYTTFMRMPTFGLPEWKQMIESRSSSFIAVNV